MTARKSIPFIVYKMDTKSIESKLNTRFEENVVALYRSMRHPD